MKNIVKSVAVVDYGMGNLRSVAQAVMAAAEGSGWLELQVDPSGYAGRFGAARIGQELRQRRLVRHERGDLIDRGHHHRGRPGYGQ